MIFTGLSQGNRRCDASDVVIGDPASGMPHGNLIEPERLLEHFCTHPPEGFGVARSDSNPIGFDAPLDLLTTMDPARRRQLEQLPLIGRLARRLCLTTRFWGSTVSEYVPLPASVVAGELVDRMMRAWNSQSPLMIIKDLPHASPLLSAEENAFSARVVDACVERGFVMVEGQALAYVPIDFASTDEFLSRLSAGRRRDIRRKLRSRRDLDIEVVETGDRRFEEAEFLAELYTLYRAVYDQSEIHFDLLSPAFFRAVLLDGSLGGRVFLYRHKGTLVGYNLCFVNDGVLIDKYIGLRYPDARQQNIYAVSWMENLAYAQAHGLRFYVAGWTDPQIKAHLGAKFTFTRHAVWVRSRLLRRVSRHLSRYFEGDRMWFEQRDCNVSLDS